METGKAPTLLGEALLQATREAVREEILAAIAGNGSEPKALLTPEELADRLKVPLSWV
ncbi:MAG: hypothetical protein HYY46_26500 [Deltaproteobacteria bacterium]|nr:hypothetical protein [Deltaproteobacteria bacterium]